MEEKQFGYFLTFKPNFLDKGPKSLLKEKTVTISMSLIAANLLAKES